MARLRKPAGIGLRTERGVMAFVVGDVGGTNTRLALGDSAGLRGATTYRNCEFGSFYDVLDCFLRQNAPHSVTGCCFAIAGPVSGQIARLTNRDWSLSVSVLKRRLPELESVVLMNDLSALGHALQDLRQDQVCEIRSPEQVGATGQTLVVGLGTGMNVSLRVGAQVAQAELGHACLSTDLSRRLERQLGSHHQEFRSNEDLFSGRGLERVYQIMTGERLSGAEIQQRSDTDSSSAARHTLEFLSHLLGVFVCDLRHVYLPMGGVFFTGSVARTLLHGQSSASFLQGFDQGDTPPQVNTDIGLFLITDDAAALRGAARVLNQTQDELPTNGIGLHQTRRGGGA